ncbi:hypothetical protein GALL_164370 [mine drainage metagenome]|uniref:Uncharacterized protein n=1 Tax=mine drainage metagenome TaxID=410659 RepID=A0A1J5SBW6_9ZZZZ
MNPSLPPDDDTLDTWLRRGADIPLPDDGMAKRVLEALPTPAAPVAAWTRWLPVGLGALGGLLWIVPSGRFTVGTGAIDSTTMQLTALLSDPGALLTLAICAVLVAGYSLVGDLLED